MIKLVIFDVDGTFTNGGITYHSDGTESKTYNAKDGLIVPALPKIGIQTAVITGRGSPAVVDRMTYLGVSEIVTNCWTKPEEVGKLSEKLGISPSQIAYVGDDLNDLRAMKLCGFKACPADASPEIKQISDYISPKNGGDGAIRDICEKIIHDCNLWDDFIALWQ